MRENTVQRVSAEPWARMLEFNSSSPFWWLHALGNVIEHLPLHASVYSSGNAVVQSLSHVQLFVTLWTAARRLPCPSPSLRACSNSCPSSQWCHPTISSCVIPFSSCLQSFPAAGSFLITQLFASCGQSFSYSIRPSSEYSGLISFRIDWFDLLAVQGTLKRTGTLQQHSSKASILWCSAFFMVQLSHPYMTTGKTIALIRWTFVGKVMSLCFNMLPRFVIPFLPRSNFNFPVAVTMCSDFGT